MQKNLPDCKNAVHVGFRGSEDQVCLSSHIAQITDILDFLNEYCQEKSETFTEF